MPTDSKSCYMDDLVDTDDRDDRDDRDETDGTDTVANWLHEAGLPSLPASGPAPYPLPRSML